MDNKDLRGLLDKKESLLLLISILFAWILSNNIFHLTDLLGSTAPYFFVGIIGSLLGFLLLRAGLIVIKSLIYVAAELSLIIFLAQSYCSQEVTRSLQSDNAIKGLIVVGFIYVSYRFLNDVYSELIGTVSKLREADAKWSWRVIFVALLLFSFTCFFAWSVFLVMQPIVESFCIYKL